jgi:hypothetical protein
LSPAGLHSQDSQAQAPLLLSFFSFLSSPAHTHAPPCDFPCLLAMRRRRRLVLACRRPPPATAGDFTRVPFRSLPEYPLLRPDCGACSPSPETLATARLIRPSLAASSATAARRGSAMELLDPADRTAPAGWQRGCNPGDRDLLPRRLHAPTMTPAGRRCPSNPGVALPPASAVL